MPIIESKFLTELYEIRRLINQEIIDLNVEERTAHFRRNAKAALASRNLKIRTVVTPEMEENRRRAASWGGGGRGISKS
jgi:hypothetical protein